MDEIPIYESKPCSEGNEKKILVLSGAGVKAIVHLGALFALQELGILKGIETFAGTSSGSLVMSLYVLGYTPSELYDFIKLFDFKKLKSISLLNIAQYGLDTGSKIEYVIQKMIERKGFNKNVTLQEIYNKTRKKMIFSTICLNTMQVCYLCHEKYPDLPLWTAIRMSSSIPLIYTPVKYNGEFYIDGGCIDNYPIHLFKNEIHSVIGILILDSNEKIVDINNIETYILRILNCVLVGINYNAKIGYENQTVIVNVQSVHIVDYEIGGEIKDDMFIKGYEATINFFNSK